MANLAEAAATSLQKNKAKEEEKIPEIGYYFMSEIYSANF